MALDSFYWKPSQDDFLIVSALVPYKRIDLAVRVFARTGQRLIIAGSGGEYRRLKAVATPNIKFTGYVPDAELRELYAHCRALLLPGEEDFGITAVEALASGKPVIALGRGGVLESVPLQDPCGGIFYESAEEEQLLKTLEAFECMESYIEPRGLQNYAQRFSEREFVRKMAAVLDLPGVAAASCVPAS